VVVGSQSSGKSSLLENLTGFAFPRGQGLCTRYATQITLRRHSVKSIVISITPRHDADVELKEKLREFHRELDDFDGRTLGKVIEEANTAMGIRSGPMKDDQSLPVFSEDILKVEISGPEVRKRLSLMMRFSLANLLRGSILTSLSLMFPDCSRSRMQERLPLRTRQWLRIWYDDT